MLHYICSIEVLTLLIGSVLSPPINSLSVKCAHVHRYLERNDFNQFRRAMNNGDRRVNSSYHACFQLIKSPDFSCYPWHAFKRITRHIYIYIFPFQLGTTSCARWRRGGQCLGCAKYLSQYLSGMRISSRFFPLFLLLCNLRCNRVN